MVNPINKLIADQVKIECEMFRRGIFDFITLSERGHHVKQEEALCILTDKPIRNFYTAEPPEAQNRGQVVLG